MDEGEIMEWDQVPPDMGSSDLFFTEESYNKFSIEANLSKQIISKYMELGPYSYTNHKDLSEVNLDKKSETTSASQPSPSSASQPSPSSVSEVNGLKNSQESITTNVNDAMEKGSNPLPESTEPVKSLDGGSTSDFVFEMPFTCKNSVKPVSAPPSEEQAQNTSGRKRLQYPRYSLLSYSEQNFYVSKFMMYKKKRPDPGCPEYAQFLKLHQKVQKEQEEFIAYLRKASMKFKEDYAFLQEVAAEYMQKKHQAILKRLQEHSPHYLPIDMLPIITNHCTKHELLPIKILLQMGEVPVSFQFLNKKMKTLLDYEILQQRFPTDRTQMLNNEPFYCHQVCSEDTNAQRLAQKYQCNIVVSSSVLKCLVDNHAPHFEKSWDVPVSVQEYQLEAPEKVMHKVVFIDKPFHRQQTTRDINTTFHKISLAARVLHPNHMSTHTFQPSSTLQKRLTSDDGTTNDIYPDDLSSLETFGTSTSKTNFGNITKKLIKEKRNSAEISSLENKIKSSVCERKGTKESLSEDSDLKPAERNGDINASPQVSSIVKLSGENQSEEKSQTNTISESFSENTLQSILKNLDQDEPSASKELFEQNQNDSYTQPENTCIDEKIDSTDSCSLEKRQVCPSSESTFFEEADGTRISNEEGTKTNTKQEEKQPEGIETKNNEDKGSLDALAGGKEIITGSCILDEVAPEDEDSDSSPELVIHFESSDTDDALSENKSIYGKSKVSTKLPDTHRSKITVTQVPYIPGSPTADAPASPSALILDAPGSPTPDAPGSPTPDAPASPTPDAPASPTPDAPASPTPDAPAAPTPDAPASPTPDAPASPTPDAPASPTPDAPASPTPDAPVSPTPNAPGSPLSIQENLSQPFDRPMVIIPTESNVNVFEFDDIKPKIPIISDPGSSTDAENASLFKKRKHHTAFGLGPLDSILEKQEELLKTTTRIKSANTGTKATTAIPEMKSKSTLKQPNNSFPEINFNENPTNYLKPKKGNNITYCIWHFGDLRLLVRCKYSAVRKVKKTKDFVYLMPKLEYQVGFGHEQTTLSEASQMWISSLIRHNCFINRIRINAFSSDIMMEETLSFHQINQLYNPVSANTFMYNLFQKLHSLKPGSYLLSHTAGENTSVISQAMPENPHPLAFDLKKMYPENIPIHIPKEIPWVPLDPNLLTQYHEFYGRVPCSFHPPDLKDQNSTIKTKKNKKKNKKKK